jgi:hypothetical protein
MDRARRPFDVQRTPEASAVSPEEALLTFMLLVFLGLVDFDLKK